MDMQTRSGSDLFPNQFRTKNTHNRIRNPARRTPIRAYRRKVSRGSILRGGSRCGPWLRTGSGRGWGSCTPPSHPESLIFLFICAITFIFLYCLYVLREAAKKVFFLVARPLRGEGGNKGLATKKEKNKLEAGPLKKELLAASLIQCSSGWFELNLICAYRKGQISVRSLQICPSGERWLGARSLYIHPRASFNLGVICLKNYLKFMNT